MTPTIYLARQANVDNNSIQTVGYNLMDVIESQGVYNYNINCYDEQKTWLSQEKELYTRDCLILYDNSRNNLFGKGTYDAIMNYHSQGKPIYRFYNLKNSNEWRLYTLDANRISLFNERDYARYCKIPFGVHCTNAAVIYLKSLYSNREPVDVIDKELNSQECECTFNEELLLLRR